MRGCKSFRKRWLWGNETVGLSCKLYTVKMYRLVTWVAGDVGAISSSIAGSLLVTIAVLWLRFNLFWDMERTYRGHWLNGFALFSVSRYTIEMACMSGMISFADFEGELQNALVNLNDPSHVLGPTVIRVLHVQRMDQLRVLLLEAIDSLRPDASVPFVARAHRFYDLLRLRFVEELPQQECSRRLGLSSRHLRREQQQAIHLLAERLWPQGTGLEATEIASRPVAASADVPTSTWRAQFQQELSSLHQHVPAEFSRLADVIYESVTLYSTLEIHPHVHARVGEVADDATVAIHPMVLGQTIFLAIEKLASNGITREIVVSGLNHPFGGIITLQSRPASPDYLPNIDFIAETVAVHGGRVAVNYADGWATIELHLAMREKFHVLVIDDNLDLVHFYKRYVEGTSYEVDHVSQGGDVWAAVARRRPDLMVLDVMLPDINGWHLLHELRQNVATAQIPIVVCSVINQDTLAKTLGAAAYLAKPVHRQAFIQTLDSARSLIH